MGLNQTNVLNEKVVQIGSGALLYSLDGGASFTGLGAADSIVATETITPLDGEPDNAVKPRRADGVAEQTVTITANLWENDPDKIAALRGGIDTVTKTTGTPVAGAGQTIASGGWSYNVPVEIEGQNASGSAPTINSITGGVDGLLVENTDFYLQKDNSTKKWSVVFIDSVTITTEAQDMVLDYDYTPASNTKVTSGGVAAAGRVWMRIINRTVDKADATVAAELGISEGDSYYYVSQYDYFYSIVNAGKSQTLKNKDDTNPTIVVPISMIAESDPDRADGENLFEENYYNEVIS